MFVFVLFETNTEMRCMFANATFTGGCVTARSHENRSRGVVLSCRVRWHMRGGMRVPYHARALHQCEQRSRFGHCGWALPGSCGPAWLAAGWAWPWLAEADPGWLGLALAGWGWPLLHTQHTLTKLTTAHRALACYFPTTARCGAHSRSRAQFKKTLFLAPRPLLSASPGACSGVPE